MIDTAAPPRRGLMRAVLVSLRPYQWVKNLLVIVPAVAAHRSPDATLVWPALLAFVCFCLAASGIYVLNDTGDAAADRLHPRKRFRPVAAGELRAGTAWIVAAICLLASLAVSWIAVSGEFTAMLVLYVAMASAYSHRLKREPVVDVFVLAALYAIRVLAGGVATDVPISTWFLAFAMFLFLSLAFVKRYTRRL